jgi:hypothetical protein
LATLLRACPNITLLATSREPLRIDGERVHRVPSLGTPAADDDVEGIRASESVRLFADRAAQHGVPLAWDEPTGLGRRPDLPAAGRPATGHRVGRGPTPADVGDRAGCPAGSAFLYPHRRLARGAAAPADPARRSRLVLGAADRCRAAGTDRLVGLRRGGSAWPPPRRSPQVRMFPRTRSSGTSARWSTRAWSSSTTPAPGQPGTGCWRQSGNTRPGSSKRRTRRRMPRGSPTATTTWLSRKRRLHSSRHVIRPSGWTVSISSSATSGPRSPSA